MSDRIVEFQGGKIVFRLKMLTGLQKNKQKNPTKNKSVNLMQT